MAYNPDIAESIRTFLAREQNVREVTMFGGLSFMVNNKMTATANSDGNLMVRCDPDRVDELLAKPGADWPMMRGRHMSRGWIVVEADHLITSDDVASWLEEALTYNHHGCGKEGVNTNRID